MLPIRAAHRRYMINAHPYILVETLFIILFPNRRQRLYQRASIIPGPSSNLSGLHVHLVFALDVTLPRQGEDGFGPPVSCP
jgi:hypothetical protein